MVSLSTKTDRNGFWYLIEVSEDCNFTLSYIVVGSGGRQSSGEISGSAYNPGEWQFQAVNFPVLRVGITDLRIDKQALGPAETPYNQQQVDSLSRRKAIKTFASAFLAGGAMLLLPSNSSGGETLPGKRTTSEEASGIPDSYNPYGDERAHPFNPY